MQQIFKKSLAVAAALACCATTVHAGDAEGTYTGYFRAGAGTNSGGGSQACYGLEGVPKYRFGNECDLYAEFGYVKELAKSSNGASFVGTVMAATYAPMSDIGSDNHFDLNQVMVEAKNVPFLQGSTAWIGKRFYDRPDIHVLDFKYLHGDGVGGGIAGIAMGPGKFSYALFRNDLNASVAATRHSFIYEGIPVNPGGSLKLDGTIIRGDQKDDNDPDRVQNGWSFSVVHKQDKLLGGDNTLAVQFGKGSGIKMGGTDTGASEDVKRTRVFDNLIWQFTPEFSGSLVGLWQRDKEDGNSRTWTSIGVRPVYAINENVKLILDLGHDNVKPSGGETQKLTKVTFAPALTQGKGFWARPELRAFVTYAKWNDAAQNAATAGSTLSKTGVFGGSTNGTSVGMQVEAWF